MTLICCPSVKSPPRRSGKKLQYEPKSVRFNGNVVGDVSSGILTDDRRDDLVASLFEEFPLVRGKDRRHGRARKKKRRLRGVVGRNGLRREIHPGLPENVGAINSCRSPAVSLAGSTCCRGEA